MTKIIITFFLLVASTAFASNGRFGVGISDQADSSIESISFKVHTSKRSAYGGLVGISNAESGGHVFGLKLYRKLIQENNLNFYGSIYGGYKSEGSDSNKTSGFQGDLTLGAEYFFQGLDQLGFSFETGVSINTYDDFEFKTKTLNLIQGAIHFYL